MDYLQSSFTFIKKLICMNEWMMCALMRKLAIMGANITNGFYWQLLVEQFLSLGNMYNIKVSGDGTHKWKFSNFFSRKLLYLSPFEIFPGNKILFVMFISSNLNCKSLK